MGVYRIVWSVGAGVVGVLGVVGGVLTLPPGALVAVTLCAALVGGTACSGRVGWRDSFGQVPVRSYATAAGTSAAAGVAVAGLVAAAGPLGAALAALTAAASPPALLWVVGRLTSRANHRGPQLDVGGDRGSAASSSAAPVYPPPAWLTTDQLCLAWRSSFTALQRASNAAEQARLAECRRGFLDELERRDPAGFARWLADGARAASNPGRYVAPPVHRSRRQSTQPPEHRGP